MRNHQAFWGNAYLKITSAEPLNIVQMLSYNGFSLLNVTQVDCLTVEVCVSVAELRKICGFLKQKPCEYTVVHKSGIFWTICALRKRAMLIIGVLLILLATILIPTRIFFVKVSGNETIPDRYILEYAQACGITFGASRKQVRSEKMKNSLLEAVPELQWAGINTAGCVATIQVREKNITSDNKKTTGISHIVADRDGIIYSCTVEKGNLLCRVGQAVSRGQVLVSGYQDSGLVVTGKNVKADIYALTNRSIETVSPCVFQKRSVDVEQTIRYSIRIGKNIIKLYKDSGIYDGTCVKMYLEEYIPLPGGFFLPIAIIQERILCGELTEEQQTDTTDFFWLNDYAADYLKQHMVAGQILYETTSGEFCGDAFVLHGDYACLEMIGKNKTEEIINNYGKND